MSYRKFVTHSLWALLIAALATACGGGGSGDTTVSTPISTNVAPVQNNSLDNVLPVSVDAGPGGNNVNRLYTSVTICQPGSTVLCQTIDHILVDTGSTGLRILSSVLAPGLNLSRVTGTRGFPLIGCAQFVDHTYAWGPVVSADILLAGKKASSVPVHVIADPALSSSSSACSSGTVITTVNALGANGIIGLGLFKEDCGSRCTTVTRNGYYYTCTDATCTTVSATVNPLSKQLKNPVALFAADNNGILIDLPAVSTAGSNLVTGTLTFGIGTQTNNQLTTSTVMTSSSTGMLSTLFSGKTLSTSFIDTGSNGLFFDSSSIPTCASGGNAGFYCPTALTTFSTTLVSTGSATSQVSFSIDNALKLFASSNRAALPTLAGPIGDALTFDWGLPFFYGRKVFLGIEGSASSSGTGPFYAF
jgi:Protein of unknown function (DUF3443)